MMTLTLCKGSRPLYCLYEGRAKAQPAFVVVDFINHNVYAEYSSEDVYSVTEPVLDRRISMFMVYNHLSLREINNLLKVVYIAAQDLEKEYTEKEYDGHFYGVFTEKGLDIIKFIEHLCDETFNNRRI